ncbi:zinc carboxypeptidase domain-containing protein [Ditylenchus destructor]|nr:zinc carboxypeptidase domain-containing protein [Ditylenchus destructor]
MADNYPNSSLSSGSTSLLLIGNVKKPSNDEERPMSGTLIFDANFESGNLGRVDVLGPNEYDLFIRPDTCNPKHRVWFYFAVYNAKANQRVVFNVVNFSKMRTLFDSGSAAPVYKADTETEWNRVPAKHIYYYKSQPHGDRFILSFVHIFQSRNERCEFAYCIPYTYSHLQSFLGELEAKDMPHFKRETLTLSVQKRRVDLLTITSPELMIVAKTKIIFIMGRVHPGETPSSIVLQGFIQFLVSDNSQAQQLRSLYIFRIIPMLNPDGVYLGNYRCSLMGFDLNRQWQNPSVWAHPSIAAAKNLLLQYHSNPKTELYLCIDVHAHSQQTNSFLYGNLPHTLPKLLDRQLYIPHLLAQSTEDYSLQYTQFNTDVEKAGTNRRAMGEILDNNCLCYTLEVSFFSYRPKDDPDAKSTPYLEDTYKLLGENLAIAILGYHQILTSQRTIEIKRPFETFLSRRCIKTFKQMEARPNRSLSHMARGSSRNCSRNSTPVPML